MKKSNYLYIAFLLLVQVSCQHRYFDNAKKIEISSLVPESQASSYCTYFYNMNAYNYFKNKKENMILLTENATNVYDEYIKFYKAEENIFYTDQPDSRENKWIKVEMTCLKDNANLLEKGSTVLIRVRSGKNEQVGENKIEKNSLVKTFEGKVGDFFGRKENNLQVVYIDKIHLQRKKDRVKTKCIDKNLSFLARPVGDRIEIIAVIANRYRSDSRKPKLFDIADIFGGNITLIDKNDY